MKILLIRFSSIGDIVLTSPIIRCIKQQLANAEIHFLTKNSFRDLVEANPNITKVIGFENDIKEVQATLENEQYDVVIDLHDNIRSRQVCQFLNAKVYRYNKQRFKRFMLVQFKINWLNNHIVDRYFSAAKKLNVLNDGKGLDFFISPKNEISYDKLPFTHCAGFAVIVVGAKHFTKQIPLKKLEELCRKISIPIILIGDKNDSEKSNQLAKIDEFKIYNACGKFNLQQSASIIKKAKYIITPDTGMMHIAAAFNKRIIAVFGGTDKRLGFTPYTSSANWTMIENTSLSCRPCHKHGLPACPKKHFKCMNDLEMQKIIDLL